MQAFNFEWLEFFFFFFQKVKLSYFHSGSTQVLCEWETQAICTWQINIYYIYSTQSMRIYKLRKKKKKSGNGGEREREREGKVENKKTRYWQISCHCSSKVVSRMFLGRFSYLGSLSFSLRGRPRSSRSNLPISSFLLFSASRWRSELFNGPGERPSSCFSLYCSLHWRGSRRLWIPMVGFGSPSCDFVRYLLILSWVFEKGCWRMWV